MVFVFLVLFLFSLYLEHFLVKHDAENRFTTFFLEVTQELIIFFPISERPLSLGHMFSTYDRENEKVKLRAAIIRRIMLR